jgi:copper transport protein
MRALALAGAAVLVTALVLALAPARAGAHAGLVRSDPAAGATLGASPALVRLSFSERPEASLSQIRVAGERGAQVRAGRLEAEAADPLTLTVPVPRLPRGVYTVTYRVVSAVDGHASSGAYAFGVRASPAGAAVAAPETKASTSKLELVARLALLAGLVALLGAAVAGVAGFGGTSGSDLRLAAAGWAAAAAGVALLAAAQRRAADTSLADLLGTPVGHALVWRAVAIGAAGVALLLARRRPELRRVALAGAALAALAAVVVHVDAGHAAAGSWPRWIAVGAQVAHFAAAGIWFGGLAALLLGVRGEPSAAKAAAVGRFAAVALGALIVVAATGTLRSIDELGSVGDLVSTGYGRAIAAKIVLLALIVAIAARNRRRGAGAAASDLGPLRRMSRVELGLAACALAAAAVLGTLAPPVAAGPGGPRGLSATGADFATTTRVRLLTASPEPGSNRFTAKVADYDSGDALRGARVRLRFEPLDDPGVAPTTLALRPGRGGAYGGIGPNLAFDGRWRVTALVERARESVEVPVDLDVRGPENFLSVLRTPGQAPRYTLYLDGFGTMTLSPHPERAGPSRVVVEVDDLFGSRFDVRQFVLTTRVGDGPARQRPVRPLGRGLFVSQIALPEGRIEIAVVATERFGTRLRGVWELDVPGR